ncbi:MAG TPA: nucleotide pyrophosphatase/phosphodiesterase family protein [Planctomycetota bacterium]|nr:nucleotide pyrophosphatase/phosphodiesterase family protein [Planctomycetota bacterium]
MTPVLVLNVVGLTRDLLTRFPQRAKNLVTLASEGQSCNLGTVLPAVTCSVQSTFLTGLMPRDHGIVANGWYFRELAEVHFWKQSNALVTGEKIWQAAKARNKDFTSAKLFWWYNMYSGNDYAVTPRPAHLADGSLISLTYTDPPQLASELDGELGHFPLFKFWGPDAGIGSSEWIEKCTHSVLRRYAPKLTLVYLPHLDYNLQRIGPNDPRIGDDVAAVDKIVGRLVDAARAKGIEVVVLSEYGMSQSSGAVDINRVLRRAGYLRVQQQHTWELLDCGASRAFAVSDHQVAHVYVKDAADVAAVKLLLQKTPGIERVLDAEGIKDAGLDHPRAGELVAISADDKWFTYYYWEDDARCPPWAHEVDIHNKPGYDPVELFLDPKEPLIIPRIISRLLLRKLGFNVTIMDFIPFDASLVKGSHGRLPDKPEEGPLLITSGRKVPLPESLPATEVKPLLLKLLFGA